MISKVKIYYEYKKLKESPPDTDNPICIRRAYVITKTNINKTIFRQNPKIFLVDACGIGY